MSNVRRAFRHLCANAGFGSDWTTYELRHSFVSLVADQLDDHVDTRTTEGYRHAVRPRCLVPSMPGNGCWPGPRTSGTVLSPRRCSRPVESV